MKKTAVVVGAMMVLLDMGTAGAQETKPVDGDVEEQVVKNQTLCPVMGGQVNTNLYVDAHGKRIYVCCKMCVGEVKKNPAKYITKLEAEGVTLDKTPRAATTNAPAASLHQGRDGKADEHKDHHR